MLQMTDIVLFQLHFSICQQIGWIHYTRTRQSSQCAFACICKFLFGHVWWTWMWACMSCFREVSISSVLSPLLGCRGQLTKNNHGSHPVFPPSGCTSIASLTIVHRHTSSKRQVELQSQGTWTGGEAEKGGGGFPCEGRKDGRKAG